VILRYGDKQIKEAMELRNLVASTAVNTKIKLKIWRNEKTKEVTVVIQELPR
ncbi:MAG: DegQ family serine endoprotease, partial [Deltaproteobacteria bacterium]